jgi:hypothetical protein
MGKQGEREGKEEEKLVARLNARPGTGGLLNDA